MAGKNFSTEAINPAHQFEAWRDWFWPIFDISPLTDTGACYRARNRVWNLGGIIVSCVSAPGARVTRNRSNIRKAPVDHWVLSYCRDGATTIKTESGLIQAPPAVPYVWSLAEESETERTKVDRIQIMIPRDTFHDISAPLDAARGSVLDNPLGSVLGQYMAALEHWLATVPEDAMPRMGRAVSDMVAACVAPSRKRAAAASDEFMRIRAERVRRAIREQLTSPHLRPEALCKVVGMSRSELYRQFERIGGVARYIRHQRLKHAYAVLSDPRSSETITAVSQKFCFADVSSFSRAFRQEFECSPSEVRASATSSAGFMRKTGQRSDSSCFDDFLRRN